MKGNWTRIVVWELEHKTVCFMLKFGEEITLENVTDVWVFPKKGVSAQIPRHSK